MTLEKDSYPLRMREQLHFSCQNAAIRGGAFIVAMALLPYKIYFVFQRKEVNGQFLPRLKSRVSLPILMTQIHVTGNDTMQIAETAKFLIEQLGGEKAVISIETHPAGDGIHNNEDVSIRFAAWDKQPHRDEINLEITGLTAGYNGTGPRNLLDVLRASGVTEEMLTSEEVQNPRFAEVTRCWKRSATTYSDMNEADVFPLHV